MDRERKGMHRLIGSLSSLRVAVVFFVLSAILRGDLYLMGSYGLGGRGLVENVEKVYTVFITIAFVFLLRWLIADTPFMALRKYTVAPMLRTMINLVIFFGAAMYLLHELFGVDMLPLLTTSAVLTGIIALSLQDTIKNLFTGLWINTDRIVAKGDWVRVTDQNSGNEITGRVMEVTWRTTRLLTRENEYVFLPNKLLAEGILTNYTCPTPHLVLHMEVGAAYRHPPNKVKGVLRGVIESVPRAVDAALSEVWVSGYGDHAINYALRLRIDDFSMANNVRNEINTKIWYAFKRNSIEIPFPIRTVHMKEEPPGAHPDHIAKALSSIDFLAPLTGEELRVVGDSAHMEAFGPGERIINEGEEGDSCYFIESGGVEVLHGEGTGRRSVVAALGPGDFFGEMSLFTGEPRKATVTAVADTTCIVIGSHVFEGIFKNNPGMAERLSAVLARRTTELERSRADAAHKRPETEIKENILSKITSFFKL